MPLSEPVLSIGGIQFQVYEQPDTLPLGGEQATNVIKFPGGNINVQTLGAFEDPITFTGTFWYEGALTRAEQLDKFRIQGNEVLLKWGSVARYVVVTKFTPTIHTAEWVDYSIEMQPTRSSDTLIATGSAPVKTKPSDVQSQAAVSPSQANNAGVVQGAARTLQSVKYRVKAGDTLWKIAVQFYGKNNGAKFTLIAQANNIDNPNQIQKGQLLTIPQ